MTQKYIENYIVHWTRALVHCLICLLVFDLFNENICQLLFPPPTWYAEKFSNVSCIVTSYGGFHRELMFSEFLPTLVCTKPYFGNQRVSTPTARDEWSVGVRVGVRVSVCVSVHVSGHVSVHFRVRVSK